MAARKPSTSKPAAGDTDGQVETEQREDERLTPQVDVVAMPSRKADGSPDQTDGYLILDHAGDAQPAADVVDDVEAEAGRSQDA